MKPPTRWKDAPHDLPTNIAELLDAGQPTRRLSGATRQRSARRLASMLSLPVAAAWIAWVKGIAIASVAGAGLAIIVKAPSFDLLGSHPVASTPAVASSARVAPRPPPAAI